MDEIQILLGKNKSKSSSNEENNIEVSLSNRSEVLPTTSASDTIDEYEQYLKEKDESDKYHFIFTVNPVCSNVLFNAITEIVYKEGSDDCVFVGNSGPSPTKNLSLISGLGKYQKYKGYDSVNNSDITRTNFITDTGYSSKYVGPFVYHCGYDIFNNHTLRHKEFSVINKLNSSSSDRKSFNTLSDYLRDADGNDVKEILLNESIGKANSLDDKGRSVHQYMDDTVYSFSESIDNNLIEENGWLGFTNPTLLSIDNYQYDEKNHLYTALNKCMNNNKPCEFIDMYPDRSLYSFIPKFNKYRNRIENNWDYCLTYPYRNDYEHELVCSVVEGEDINGIPCVLKSKFKNKKDDDSVMFITNMKHNFSVGDRISISILYKKNGAEKCIEVKNTVTVTSLGTNGGQTDHYFSVSYDKISDYKEYLEGDEGLKIEPKISDISARVRKCSLGKDCTYYLRIFKRIPNFRNSNVYPSDGLVKADIDEYCKVEHDFDSSINKVAFSRNIYNDFISQIVYNDTIDITGLTDNYGRKLHEVYITFVKRNKGYKEWYKDKNYTSKDVEFSHCFGRVSAGLDLPSNIYDYNVHRIHNVDVDAYRKKSTSSVYIPDSPKDLEGNIDSSIEIGGDPSLDTGEFYGDIVEFSPYELTETTLENIYFRFNTEQREIVDDEYANIMYQNIDTDDYDMDAKGNTINFKLDKGSYNTIKDYAYTDSGVVEKDTVKYPSNVLPEGYFYQAHYRINVREFDDIVKQGSHTRIAYSINSGGNSLSIHTAKNYGIELGEKLIMFDTSTMTPYDGIVTDIKGYDVTVNVPSKLNQSKMYIFKRNDTKPDGAYELNDGTGRYIWREIKKEINIRIGSELYNSVFTNGHHYFHKNINFFLRRQDPYGEYGLTFSNAPTKVQRMIIQGEKENVDTTDTKKKDDSILTC